MLARIPALSENKTLRFTTATAMYLAQGIQNGLMFVALPAYFAAQGVSPAGVGGFIGAAMLPWSLKILAAPIMDRFSYLPMGRRRPWVLFGMAGAFLGYLVMGLVEDPLNQFSLFTATAVLVSFFTAFMDVAIDGLVIEIFPLKEQPTANSFMWGSKIIGTSATAAGSVWTMNQFGVEATCFISAACSVGFLLFPVLFRERPGEKILPWSHGAPSREALELQMTGWVDIFRSLLRVVFLPASIILAIVAFIHGISYGLFDAIMPVITVQELDWTDQGYSNLSAMSGLIAGVIGILIGGWLVNKLGRKRSLSYLLLNLIGLSLIMGLVGKYWDHRMTVQAFVLLMYTSRTLLLITLFATAMAISWRPVAATQFALYMAISNFGITLGASILGPLKSQFTYPQIFLVFSIIVAIALAVLSIIKLEKHVILLDALTEEKVGHEIESSLEQA